MITIALIFFVIFSTGCAYGLTKIYAAQMYCPDENDTLFMSAVVFLFSTILSLTVFAICAAIYSDVSSDNNHIISEKTYPISHVAYLSKEGRGDKADRFRIWYKRTQGDDEIHSIEIYPSTIYHSEEQRLTEKKYFNDALGFTMNIYELYLDPDVIEEEEEE